MASDSTKIKIIIGIPKKGERMIEGLSPPQIRVWKWLIRYLLLVICLNFIEIPWRQQIRFGYGMFKPGEVLNSRISKGS